MGERGPAPKRSSQRRRRNKPDVPITTGSSVDVAPPEPRETWHPLATSWYESLAESGQSAWYEPSDWWMAQWCAELMTEALNSGRPAPLAAQIRGLMTDLLVPESARRRVSIELERASGAAGDDEVVSELDAYRRRTGSGAG